MSWTQITKQTIEITASVDKVWPLIAKVENWQQWDESVREIHGPEREVEKGDAIQMAFFKGPKVEFAVTEVNKFSLIRFETKMMAAPMRFEYTVTPKDKTVIAGIEISSGGVWGMAVAMMVKSMFAKNIHSELTKLKQVVEN